MTRKSHDEKIMTADDPTCDPTPDRAEPLPCPERPIRAAIDAARSTTRGEGHA